MGRVLIGVESNVPAVLLEIVTVGWDERSDSHLLGSFNLRPSLPKVSRDAQSDEMTKKANLMHMTSGRV